MTITPIGIPSAEAIGADFIITASSWWNGTYIYRRRVTVTALGEELPVGHPVVVPFDAVAVSATGKLRSDFGDLEVVQVIDPPGGWRWIGREVKVDEGEVCFLLGDAIAPGGSGVYYIHYGKPVPTIVRPVFLANYWPMQVPQDDPAIAYVKPGKFWRNGVTRVPGAEASFVFLGSSVRVMAVRGPDQAIVEVQIDDGAWMRVDLFFLERETSEVFLVENLAPTPHKIRLRSTNHANTSAHGRKVELVRFDYVVAMEQVLDQEEVFADLWGGGGLGGA